MKYTFHWGLRGGCCLCTCTDLASDRCPIHYEEREAKGLCTGSSASALIDDRKLSIMQAGYIGQN